MSQNNYKRKWSRDEGEDKGESSGDEEKGGNAIGSFSLEEVKSSEQYLRKIETSNAKKRKWALNFGYLGSQYQGLQMNPGGIAETNFADLHKIQWTRTARTDRGVHAVMQCCAMKLVIPLDSRDIFIHNVNTFLPSDIRVNGLSKVTKGFNSKLQCSRRRYHYLLPTYMLQDKSKILEYLNSAFIEQGPVTDAAKAGGFAEPGSNRFLGPSGLSSVRNKLKATRIEEEKIIILRAALKSYEGTKKFHNFTKDKHPSDPSASRYITSFTCGEPFVDLGTDSEWVLLSIVGQSFLLNQIRKMVGLACEVANGKTNMEMMTVALSDKKVEIPMAPGLGLYLDELFWDNYNKKQAKAIKESPPVPTIKQLIPTRTATPDAPDPVTAGDATASTPSDSGLLIPKEEAVVSNSLDNTIGTSNVSDTQNVKEDTQSINEETQNIKDESQNIKEKNQEIKEEVISTSINSTATVTNATSTTTSAPEDNKEEGNSTSMNIADTVTNTTSSTSSAPEGQGLEDAEEEAGEGPNLGEIIDWTEDTVVNGNMTVFREGVIWPHIFQEDQDNLHFLYYMDYLRVFSYNFHIKDYAAQKVKKNNNQKRGGNDKNWKNKIAKKEDSKKTMIKQPI